MSAHKRDKKISSGDFGSMVWVNDNQGHEFSCTLDTPRSGVRKFDELSEHEKHSCVNVNNIVGTERW